MDREQQDEEGSTAILGYVAVQPEYETEFEFTRDTVYVDLEEQRGVLSQFDIHATNKRGETLLHFVARRSASEVEGDPKLIQKDTTELFKML